MGSAACGKVKKSVESAFTIYLLRAAFAAEFAAGALSAASRRKLFDIIHYPL